MLRHASANLESCTHELMQGQLGVAGLPNKNTILCAHAIEHLDDPQAALRWVHDTLPPAAWPCAPSTALTGAPS